MATLIGKWIAPDGKPFFPDSAYITPRNGGHHCRTVSHCPNTIPTSRQRSIRSALTRAARAWRDRVDPISQSVWLNTLHWSMNRAGDSFSPSWWLAWLNSTIPRYYISPPPILIFQPPEEAYSITHMGIAGFDIPNQKIQTTITYYRDSPVKYRCRVSIYQVHPGYVADPLAWKYTRGIGNDELGPWYPIGEPTTETKWWNAHWKFASGDRVQIFSRHTATWQSGGVGPLWDAHTWNLPYPDLIRTVP